MWGVCEEVTKTCGRSAVPYQVTMKMGDQPHCTIRAAKLHLLSSLRFLCLSDGISPPILSFIQLFEVAHPFANPISASPLFNQPPLCPTLKHTSPTSHLLSHTHHRSFSCLTFTVHMLCHSPLPPRLPLLSLSPALASAISLLCASSLLIGTLSIPSASEDQFVTAPMAS